MKITTFLLCAVGLAGCCCGNMKPEKGGGASSGSSTPAQPATPAAPPMKVDVKTILKDYKDNEVRADGQYKGKAVEVTGKVRDTKKSIGDSIYVTIGTGTGPLEIPAVHCSVDDSQKSKAAALNKGDAITVRGTVTGLMMDVRLDPCAIQ